jgi:hypothetical protein
MGRKVKARDNYRAEAIFLSRLKEAVEIDAKRDDDFKRKAIGLLDQLFVLFATEGG